MADGRKPHPETDISGETIEFEAIELKPKRVCYELSDGASIVLPARFRGPIELRVGQTGETSPLFLHRGYKYPELCEAAGFAHPPTMRRMPVLIQPDVMAEDPDMGWEVCGDWIDLGRADTPQFRLGPDVSRSKHVQMVWAGDGIEIRGNTKNPTRVIVDARHTVKNVDHYIELD
jgi:hypothetical protein